MHRQHWFGNVPTDVSGEPLATDNATATTKFHLSFRRGMNCATMTDFSFSFRGFARRGGDTDVHSHGWGLCFYDGRGLRSFHDPDPAAESLLAEFLQTHPVKTLNMVSHIRYATRGRSTWRMYIR
ncbi:hypothetical protein THAOC_24758, partial [Thalassiosira oceanica]